MTRLCLLMAILAMAASGASDTGAGARGMPDGFHLDGHLREAAYGEAVLVAQLTQQSPRPGQPTPYITTVRVLVARSAIYFGFECLDPDPARISINTMQRDASLRGNDTVSIVLDPYGDKRTGYYFQINAAGARVDGLISNPERISHDWDGIWDARTARTERGWSAEVEIPVHTLNFNPGLKAWGLNLERYVARDQVTLRWNSPTLDSFLYDMSRAGSLSGVEGLTQGRGLDFTPYAIGRMKEAFGRTPRVWQGTGGLDLTWRITPQLAAVFTGNTDFAETEVDTRQINLTRFPLFFPEKRAFFLEGSNQFEFGLGLGRTFIPFFTRRVGLFRGQQIPIDAGVKLNGRLGNWNLALIDVQTRATALAPSANLFAGRISHDYTRNLRVGALFTNGNPDGRRRNTLAGLDAVWQTSEFRGDKNFMVGVWTVMTAGDIPKGRRSGWGYRVDYPNDLLDCSTTFDDFGDALAPALGFLPRPGTRQYSAGCRLMPRPSKDGPFGFIRQQTFGNRYSRVTNLRGVNESWDFRISPIDVQFESGEQFEFTWEPQYEFLTRPFEVTNGLAIPAGAHRFNRWEVEAATSSHRQLRVSVSVERGGFYNGRLTQWESSLDWTSPDGRYQVGLGAEQNFGRLPAGNFVQRLWQLQAAFAWSPNLVLTSYLQFDTESQNLGTNTRLRRTLKPGRELFFVWNRGWQRLRRSPHEMILAPDTEFLAVKLRWTFRQ